MPHLHEALVEVHREYERASKAARDMAELFKKATAVSDVLSGKCTRTQAKKDELSKKLRQTEQKLRKAEEQRLHELQQRLQEAEASK